MLFSTVFKLAKYLCTFSKTHLIPIIYYYYFTVPAQMEQFHLGRCVHKDTILVSCRDDIQRKTALVNEARKNKV